MKITCKELILQPICISCKLILNVFDFCYFTKGTKAKANMLLSSEFQQDGLIQVCHIVSISIYMGMCEVLSMALARSLSGVLGCGGMGCTAIGTSSLDHFWRVHVKEPKSIFKRKSKNSRTFLSINNYKNQFRMASIGLSVQRSLKIMYTTLRSLALDKNCSFKLYCDHYQQETP